jgi:Mn-containing catalase
MAGLVEEGAEVIQESKELDPIAADLGLIAAAQRVEHYEIAAYGASAKFAESMGRSDVAELLTQTLDEEKEADQLLTQITQPLLDAALEEGEEELEEIGSRRKR